MGACQSGSASSNCSAAAVNCLIEQRIDAVMMRTRRRPLPSGALTSMQTVTFAFIVGGVGLFLHGFVRMQGPDAGESWLDTTQSG